MEDCFSNFFGVKFCDKVDFGNLPLSENEKNKNKIFLKKRKYLFRRSLKIDEDCAKIKNLVEDIAEDEELLILSNSFDSPNIIIAYKDDIEELFIGTWAITPVGITAISEMSHLKTGVVLMDKTHSYKWIFASGAYEFLAGKVQFKFTANHSKFLAMKMMDGSYLNFIGSMNLSNNPRYENITINKRQEDFEFLSDFVQNVKGERMNGKA